MGRRTGTWLGAAVLNVLAGLGVVCIVLVILGFVFNISIIMFKTGSMSPGIPAGSAALVREIPAEDMRVGDIVTVDRGEKVLPVTHRVVDIHSVDEATGAVTFEMRGDANAQNDPDPYTAEAVRKVMFSVPGVAPILQQWRNPYLLGTITIAASLLVVWAFWPRRGDADDDDEPARLPQRSPKHALALPAVLVLALGGQVMPAAAAGSPAAGQILHMRDFGDEDRMRSLSPGASATWTVDVWADAPEPGAVTVSIDSGRTSEPLASSLLIDVSTCAKTDAQAACPDGADSPMRAVPLSELQAQGSHELFEMGSGDSGRVEVTATLAPDAEARAVAGASVGVRVIASGLGDEVSIGPANPGSPGDSDGESSGQLPWTGIEGWQWMLLLACVLIGAGAVSVAKSRDRSQSW